MNESIIVTCVKQWRT